MGTAFVVFRNSEFTELGNPRDDETVEIGRIVFRTIVEVMELEKPGDEEWKNELDAAYGIKWLYVGGEYPGGGSDFGPAFLAGVRQVRERGPPDYYPERDMALLHQQLDQLERLYLEHRPPADA
jgi:hypothetical protein